MVAGAELRAEIAQDAARLGGREVADAGADVEGEHAAPGLALDADWLEDVVSDLRQNGDTRNHGFDVAAGFLESRRTDVDGLVEHLVLRGSGGLKQESGLGGGSGTQLQDGDGAGMAEDLG